MFRIYCTNKGCGKESEALLNTETNEVECLECGKNINVPYSTKISMKGLGQIKRIEQKQAFAVECKKCKKASTPALNDNKDIICSICNEMLNVSKPFANLIKEKLSGKS